MSYEEKEAFKERKKAAAKKYYLKYVPSYSTTVPVYHANMLGNRNREAILKKADDKRWR